MTHDSPSKYTFEDQMRQRHGWTEEGREERRVVMRASQTNHRQPLFPETFLINPIKVSTSISISCTSHEPSHLSAQIQFPCLPYTHSNEQYRRPFLVPISRQDLNLSYLSTNDLISHFGQTCSPNGISGNPSRVDR